MFQVLKAEIKTKVEPGPRMTLQQHEQGMLFHQRHSVTYVEIGVRSFMKQTIE